MKARCASADEMNRQEERNKLETFMAAEMRGEVVSV
jgi:hypothetical protein